MSKHRERFGNVPDGDFGLMPQGKYPVKVIAADVHDSKSSGNPTWYLDLEVYGDTYAGKKLWLMIGMGDKSASMRKGTLTALGLDTSGDMDLDLIDDVLNRKALAEVYHEKGQDGEMREKVRRLRSIKRTNEEGPSAKLSDEQFEEQMSDGVPF